MTGVHFVHHCRELPGKTRKYMHFVRTMFFFPPLKLQRLSLNHALWFVKEALHLPSNYHKSIHGNLGSVMEKWFYAL